jgi:hypothetical protein
MLTAHALNPENLVESVKKGARCYVPKDKISDISSFLIDVLESRDEGSARRGNWFLRLLPFFDKKFGAGWREKDKEFWKDFDRGYAVKKEDVEKMI